MLVIYSGCVNSIRSSTPPRKHLLSSKKHRIPVTVTKAATSITQTETCLSILSGRSCTTATALYIRSYKTLNDVTIPTISFITQCRYVLDISTEKWRARLVPVLKRVTQQYSEQRLSSCNVDRSINMR